MYCIFMRKLYCLNKNCAIRYRTRNIFVFVPSENLGQKLCINDQIVVQSLRKQYFLYDILIISCVLGFRVLVIGPAVSHGD